MTASSPSFTVISSPQDMRYPSPSSNRHTQIYKYPIYRLISHIWLKDNSTTNIISCHVMSCMYVWEPGSGGDIANDGAVGISLFFFLLSSATPIYLPLFHLFESRSFLYDLMSPHVRTYRTYLFMIDIPSERASERKYIGLFSPSSSIFNLQSIIVDR